MNVGQTTFNRKSSLLLTEIQMQIDAIPYVRWQHKFVGSELNFMVAIPNMGACGGVVVKALRYKPAGRGFDSQWCHWNFSVT